MASPPPSPGATESAGATEDEADELAAKVDEIEHEIVADADEVPAPSEMVDVDLEAGRMEAGGAESSGA